MKIAKRALGSRVTILNQIKQLCPLSSWPLNEMYSKETIASSCVIHLTAHTTWHWIEDELIYPGKCQAFRLDFIFCFCKAMFDGQ